MRSRARSNSSTFTSTVWSTFEHLRGMLDAAPGHVGDVQQAVNAAQVNERAEVGDVLDHAAADFAALDGGEQVLLHLVALFFEQLAAREDDIAAFFVNLDDLAFQFLADPFARVAHAADINLAGGQEDVHADVHQQPALDLAHRLAFDHVADLVGLHHPFPAADAVGLLLG